MQVVLEQTTLEFPSGITTERKFCLVFDAHEHDRLGEILDIRALQLPKSIAFRCPQLDDGKVRIVGAKLLGILQV